MAMTYTSLSAAKGTAGSIANWVSYTRLDIPTILDEAQTLLYSLLRVREMQTELTFYVPIGNSAITLPDRFLDPIGRARLTSFNTPVRHKDASFIKDNRSYTELPGTFTTSGFLSFTASSDLVTVTLAAHGFMQGSAFWFSTANIAYPIVSITDADHFVIQLANAADSPGTVTSGTAGTTYLCDNLTPGIPNWFGILGNELRFDVAFSQASLGKLQYYQSLPLLSSTNLTNFLTNRYPQLMRVACTVQAADFMKDDAEYQKDYARLVALVERTSAENDGMLRGMELETMTP